MKRKHLDYAIIAAMFASGLYVTLSGLVTGVFGLHQFALHRYAGYACAVGAFLDNQLNELLELDGEQEAALYVISAGTG